MTRQALISALSVSLSVLVPAAPALAQICMGLPTGQGRISLEANALTGTDGSSYGGRLGVNFDTEYAFEIDIDRPSLAYGRGTVGSAVIGYELRDYEPPVCSIFGIRHSVEPTESGGELQSTAIPIGFGVGRQLGSARTFSLGIFARPEYLYVLKPDPPGEHETFWDELGHRSEGRGVLGIVFSTPLFYAIGSAEVTTQGGLEPAISAGVGITF